MDNFADNEAQQRLTEVWQRMAAAARRSGRDPAAVTLVGATKTVSPTRLQSFVEAGLKVCGENYVQEALPKIDSLPVAVHWHLIGALQRNKAREAVAAFELIHSVDRLPLARAINEAAAVQEKVQAVLLQVDVGDEPTKGGCAPAALGQLAAACRELLHLRISGLMCLPPYGERPEASRRYFAMLRLAREELTASGLADANWQLSMGMSNDYEVAIEEGADLVRVGSALFGERPSRPGSK